MKDLSTAALYSQTLAKLRSPFRVFPANREISNYKFLFFSRISNLTFCEIWINASRCVCEEWSERNRAGMREREREGGWGTWKSMSCEHNCSPLTLADKVRATKTQTIQPERSTRGSERGGRRRACSCRSVLQENQKEKLSLQAVWCFRPLSGLVCYSDLWNNSFRKVHHPALVLQVCPNIHFSSSENTLLELFRRPLH